MCVFSCWFCSSLIYSIFSFLLLYFFLLFFLFFFFIYSVENAREKQHETLYLSSTATRPTMLKKWKGFNVTSVGWNPTVSDPVSTREIVVGTDQSVIYEAEIAKTDKYFKPLFRLEIPKPEPVGTVRIEQLPRPDREGRTQWFFLVATAHHCFHFIGSPDPADLPIFQPVFARTNPNRRYFKVPGDSPLGSVAFYAQYPSPPSTFAWLNACGISYGNLDLRNPTTYRARDESVLTVLADEPHLWKVDPKEKGKKKRRREERRGEEDIE